MYLVQVNEYLNKTLKLAKYKIPPTKFVDIKQARRYTALIFRLIAFNPVEYVNDAREKKDLRKKCCAPYNMENKSRKFPVLSPPSSQTLSQWRNRR